MKMFDTHPTIILWDCQYSPRKWKIIIVDAFEEVYMQKYKDSDTPASLYQP